MPIVELHLLQGYGPQEKQRLHAALTDAVRLVVPASPDAITVMFHEMAPENYSRGGQQRGPVVLTRDADGPVRPAVP